MPLKQLIRRALEKIYHAPVWPNRWRRAAGLFYVLNYEFGGRYYGSQWSPGLLRKAWQVQDTIGFKYGHYETMARWSCLDSEMRPIAWYTYPALEFLQQLDFSDKAIFEYGCGNSTLFWARQARRVVSVENDAAWYAKIGPQLPPHCEITLATDPTDYINAPDSYPEGFDVIVVDGANEQKERFLCAQKAVAHLRPGGFIILDNSDFLPESSRFLRESGLLEIDFTGFGPINHFPWTTSLYLSRDYNFAPRGARQPFSGMGALDEIWPEK